LLLLAEAQQEVGASHASLATLSLLDAMTDERDADWAAVLRAGAEFQNGQLSYLLQPAVSGKLHSLADSSSQESTRARAFTVLAALAYRRRDRDAAVRLLALGASMRSLASATAALEYSLSIAMLQALCGDLASSERTIEAAIACATSARIRNASFAVALNGLGAVHCAAANFPTAIRHFEAAYQLAKHLDNGPCMLRAAANSALGHRYMGDWAMAVHWGEVALALRTNSLEGHAEIMAASVTAIAYVRLGRNAEALDLLAATKQRIGSEEPSWYTQALAFGHADALWHMGKRKAAIDVAARAIHAARGTLLSVSYARAFARWLALAAGSKIELEKAAAWLQPLLAEHETLDVSDQAEVLCAQRMILRRTAGQAADKNASQLETKLGALLARLHEGEISELRRFGLI
jgi:tetratricopeptide (TPR) repeat protein